MSYRLIIRPEAELDIQDAFEWYEAQTPGLGSEFIRAVDASLSGIGRNPFGYPKIYQQARRALLRRFPYGLLFVVEQELIAVVACFHGKRSPKSWQDRL
ncbi:type II toxin-antitoxin system RelE/ParE family toxin [Nodosilinea nodulosa]|uniref:type II toxin-antitoxin system RelE/ParE family toxin n=1 Tax=Nodosilinea nodulosa TaxID=416001 RepID=UPI0002D8ABEE|nr:type II toxin-antitoxin system RelE/ParE family toxin [Nodosilinea nodulosa]